MRACVSGAHRWERSAPASKGSPARRRPGIGNAIMRTSKRCPPASSESPRGRPSSPTDRAGFEKPGETNRPNVSSMNISLQFAHLTITDPDESIKFYRDGLGLTVHNDVDGGGHRWVTLGSESQPGVGIVLSDPYGGRSQADGDALQELLTKGVLSMVNFQTDDLDVLFDKVRATGAEVV